MSGYFLIAINQAEFITRQIIPADAMLMTDQEAAIPAFKKTAVFIIRQAGLNGYKNKILSIKTLHAIGVR